MKLRHWFTNLLNTLFPPVCGVCGRTLVEGERTLCIECDAAMPRTNIHLTPEHPLAKRLAGELHILRFASLMHYVKQTPYAYLLQKSKYGNHPEIDRDLGRRFALELLPTGFFHGIDLLVPIPMFIVKRATRGFNQAQEIAIGVSQATGIPLADNLLAVKPHITQTRKTLADRLTLHTHLYRVAYPEELASKHLLLIDDILTTGTTIASAATTLRAASPTSTLSLLTLATTNKLQ